MSSQKGNLSRTRVQKYKNRSVFKNDLHDTSHTIKAINGLTPEGICHRCKEIIEWKIKYKKYKPLSKPATCIRCKGKTVKRAYYVCCQPCAEQAQVCAKCNKKKNIEVKTSQTETEKNKQDTELQFELKQLSERERRTYLRHVESGEGSSPKGASEEITTDCASAPFDEEDECDSDEALDNEDQDDATDSKYDELS